MTTDFRALCAELADAYLRLLEYINNSTWLGYEPSDDPLLLRARAALADGPAVPEGREPASVTGQPTYDDLSKLCSQHGLDADSWPLEKFDALWQTVRAVLARWGNPAPQPPAKGEVAEFITQIKSYAEYGTPIRLIPFVVKRAADLLERLSPPQPVPVSERLPGPEDCDAEGRCWWGRNESDDWSADWTLATHEAVAEFCEFCPRTVWLPATALPIPQQQENAND